MSPYFIRTVGRHALVAALSLTMFVIKQKGGEGGPRAKWRCAEVSLSGRPGNRLTGSGPSLPLRLGLEGVRQDCREVT